MKLWLEATKNHPGNIPLLMFVAAGWAAAEAQWGAATVLCLCVPMYVYGLRATIKDLRKREERNEKFQEALEPNQVNRRAAIKATKLKHL